MQQCYHVTGASDFILVIGIASLEDYGAFARRWFESNEVVARFDTHVVLDRTKVGLSLPMGGDHHARK